MSTPTFTEALQVEVAQLQAEHPLLKAALDRAFTLLVNGDLFPLDDGHTAHVRSQSDPDASYLVNGSCDVWRLGTARGPACTATPSGFTTRRSSG